MAATISTVDLSDGSISAVDLRLLSQPDLYSLSISSPSNVSNNTLPINPLINKSVFNESAGSKKQTYSRLRLAKFTRSVPNFNSPNFNGGKMPVLNDFESVENGEIIRVLKKLFSGGDLDEVGEKRKRGRPKRNGFGNPNPKKVNFVNGDTKVEIKAANTSKRQIVKSDFFVKGDPSDVDRDRVRVNGKGVEVDLSQLASLEDPYMEELERRSAGLKTEEEFLAYLGGLSGQWGSRRKKKRVVEADEYGDVLPKGWKLLLSCKKKEGRVWLYVRRYISPNGRQFMSCKEVASYILSIFGLEDTIQPPFDQRNNNVQPTQGVGLGDTADSAVKDIKESAKMETDSPSVISFVPAQNQITSAIGSPHTSVIGTSGDVPAEKGLECGKCNMSFNGKDEYMHHKLSAHRRKRNKFGSSITDGVIIKDGEYECQFCHKRFVERHRYNGHVGAHKRHHMRNEDGSPNVVLSLPSSVDLESPYQVHPKESITQASTGDDSDSVTANYRTDGQPKLASSDSALNVGSDTETFTDKHYNEVNDCPRNEHESQSTANAQNLAEQHCFENDVDHKVNSSLGINTSLESTIPLSIDEIDTNGDLIAIEYDDCKPTPSVQNTSGDDIIMNEISDGAAGPGRQADPEIISPVPQENENTYNADITEDSPSSLPFAMSKLDTGRSEINVDQSQTSSPVPVVNDGSQIDTDGVDMVSSSALLESKQKRFSESDEEVMFGFNDTYTGYNSGPPPETDPADNSKNQTMIGRKNSVNCLNIPTQAGEFDDMVDHGRVNLLRTMEASGQGKSSDIVNASINVGNIATAETERPKIDETQAYRSSEVAFGVSHQILRPAVRRPEFGVPFLSGNQQFFAEESASADNSVLSQQKSNQDSVFRSDYCSGNPFSDVYTMGRVTNNSTEEPKRDAVLNSGNGELMIDFGNNGSEIVANPMDNVPMEQIFFEIDRSRESRRTGEVSKQESNLLGPSYYAKPGGSENYLDRIDGSVWDGPILDGAADFGNDKLMIGFGNSGAQSQVDPMGANMWRTDERNTFPSTLAGSATHHVGSSSFLNSNMISDKEDDMFLGFSGVQSAPTEHVEFSFMTPHNLDSYPRDSKTMYNPSIGQGFDSSFWLGKDDLSLNIAARNLVTSICVWCRNEFRHEPDNTGTQNGAIGSICPTCSARVSQQFNGY